MQANTAVAAAGFFGKAAYGAKTLPGALLLGGILDLLRKVHQQGQIVLLPQHHAIGRLAVASRASGFLVILLH